MKQLPPDSQSTCRPMLTLPSAVVVNVTPISSQGMVAKHEASPLVKVSDVPLPSANRRIDEAAALA